MSPSPAFQRGLLLYNQGRLDLADAEFRRGLADEPDDPTGHALLSLCLAQRDLGEESLREADEATRLAPDESLSHYARGRALLNLKRLDQAEAATDEAVRLQPFDADCFALLASIAAARGRWSEALESARRGLAIAPDHAGCVNLQGMALVQLGRRDEASAALGSALADDPENALTHANQGWALLHSGDQKRALEHFREALRLDPELEWARVGIIEALKARHLLYRTMLRFFLWMSRQGQVAQWAVILGFVFGRRALAAVEEAVPGLAPIIGPILFLSFAFLLLTWIASPLFNLLLRFNKFGRLALSPAERAESSWIGGSFLLAMVSGAAYLAGSVSAFFFLAFFGLLVLPLAVTFRTTAGRPRLIMGAITAGVACLALPWLAMVVAGDPIVPLLGIAPKRAVELFTYFAYGAFGSTWAPLLLGLRPGRG